MIDQTVRAREQAVGLDNWADVLETHDPGSSAKGILMLRAAAETLRGLTADAPEGPWDEKKAGHVLYDVVRGEGNWENLNDDERLKWIVMSRNYRYLNRLDAQQEG